MNKKLLLLAFINLYTFFITQAQHTQGSFELKVKDNYFTLNHNNIERLTGGELIIEQDSADKTYFSASSTGLQSLVNYYENKGQVRVDYRGDVATFYITSSKNNNINGSKFSGVFFELPDYLRGVSLYRYGESKAWTMPIKAKKFNSVNNADITFFYWQYKDGTYGVAMPLGGKGYSASIGKCNSKVGVKAVSLVENSPIQEVPVLSIVIGKDIYKSIEALVKVSMDAMGTSNNLRLKKIYPQVFENIGWCTWDAYGHRLNEQKVLEGVESFRKSNFPIPFVLIDDGWLVVGDDMKLKSLEADTLKFSMGFKPLVTKLKNEYKVEHVGIWHTINAYWKGIDINSTLGKKYKPILYSYQGKLPWSKDTLKTFYCPTPRSDSGMIFFNDWYKTLSDQGISFIKVDNQLVVKQIAHGKWPLWNTGYQLQKNFQQPAFTYFKGNVINCMEMSTDNIYHFGASAIARASDDYMPKEESYDLQSGNAAVHVTNCFYNSLWLSNIIWPDFDMFESHQLYPVYHAIARVISGGPVYISDFPNEQKFEILRPLILKNGRILRTDFPGQLTEDCLFQVQDNKPLKAFSKVGNTALLGIWNAADTAEVKGTFKAADIYQIEGKDFVVYEYFSKRLQIAKKDEELPIRLKRMGYLLYFIIPLEENAAAIGLLDKYNSPKTILSKSIQSKYIDLTVAEGGVLALYVDRPPKRIEVNQTTISKDSYKYDKGLLEISLPDSLMEVKVRVVRE